MEVQTEAPVEARAARARCAAAGAEAAEPQRAPLTRRAVQEQRVGTPVTSNDVLKRMDDAKISSFHFKARKLWLTQRTNERRLGLRTSGSSSAHSGANATRALPPTAGGARGWDVRRGPPAAVLC